MSEDANWDKFLTQMTSDTGNNSGDPKFGTKKVNDSADFKTVTETAEKSFGHKMESFREAPDRPIKKDKKK